MHVSHQHFAGCQRRQRLPDETEMLATRFAMRPFDLMDQRIVGRLISEIFLAHSLSGKVDDGQGDAALKRRY
nr:hypothetical protein [Burkholderia lata]